MKKSLWLFFHGPAAEAMAEFYFSLLWKTAMVQLHGTPFSLCEGFLFALSNQHGSL